MAGKGPYVLTSAPASRLAADSVFPLPTATEIVSASFFPSSPAGSWATSTVSCRRACWKISRVSASETFTESRIKLSTFRSMRSRPISLSNRSGVKLLALRTAR